MSETSWRLRPLLRLVALVAALCCVQLALACSSGLSGDERLQAPTAERGVLDLRHWNAETDGPIELRGEWRFIWGELIEPATDCATGSDGSDFSELPGVWTGREWRGEVLPAQGFASYCLKILLSPRQEPLLVYVPRLRTASELWVDGVNVAASGQVGDNRQTSRPRRIDHVSAIAPSGELDLVLRISNFHFRSGGAHRSIRIGSPVDLEPLADGPAAALTAFFVGAFVMLGLYHLLIHTIRRQSVAPLAFGLLCFAMAFYQLTRENNLFAAVLPFVSWPYEIRLEYSLFALSVPLAAAFFRGTYPLEVPRSLLTASLSTSAVFLLAIWLLPLVVTTDKVILVYQLCFAALGAWGLWCIVRAISNRRPGAQWFLIGGGLWLLTGLGDGLVLRQFPNAPRLLPLGFMGLIVAQAILLALVQAQSSTRTKQLSSKLLSLASEKLVLEQAAYRDPLTGLENRRRLDLDAERLKRGSQSGAEVSGSVSLLYLDIDDFKSYNDRYGHQVGDEILIRLAELIREEFRSYDLSVRLGGDEFAVLLTGVDEREAAAQAQRLRSRLSESFEIGTLELQVSVSIGAATVAAEGVDIGDLLRRADRAMYRDKARRKEAH